MSEVWAEIPETAGRYSVSNCGNVRANWSDIPQRNLSYRMRIEVSRQLRASTHTTGYLRIALGRGRYHYIHRLVAAAFLPNPNLLPQVDHIDGNRKNNHFENLRWVSAKENAAYGSKRHEWSPQRLASARRRLFVAEAPKFLALHKAGYSLRWIAKKFGTDHKVVRSRIAELES
jgi:hypothetical protein